MRRIIGLALLASFLTPSSWVAPAVAHHPDREHTPVHPYFDLIGPLGTRLPPSYRRRYNRPTNLGGRIAYCIAPSSQEAMSWHDSVHREAYSKHRPRIEMHYFYPKPWEVLRIGARKPTNESAVDVPLEALQEDGLYDQLKKAEETIEELDPNEMVDPNEPLTSEAGLIED